jgi:hypothetical protein
MTPVGLQERRTRIAWSIAAGVGLLAGAQTLWLHLSTDPLADVQAYYDAGARLNAGLPLYPAGADPNAPDFYRYPPLLAIAFRPLAALPFPAAAAIWEVAVIATFVATVWWLGIRRGEMLITASLLASPIAWSLAVGQAQVPLTFLTAIGTPWAIALATQVKIFPALIVLWWLGRRQWHSIRRFLAWSMGLLLLQMLLAPQATLDFVSTLTLGQVGDVRNLSPYALSPVLWALLLLAGCLIAFRLAPTRWGWVAAVALSVLATPRLLSYMFMTLIAAVRDPTSRPESSDRGRSRSDST